MPAQSSGVTTSANAKESGRMKEDVMGSIKKKLKPKNMTQYSMPAEMKKMPMHLKEMPMRPTSMPAGEKSKPMPKNMPLKPMMPGMKKMPMMDSMMGKLKAKKLKTI